MVTEKVRKKRKDMLIKKKESQYSGAMARMESCGTLHFTRCWDPHQPVSSGFTAMTVVKTTLLPRM